MDEPPAQIIADPGVAPRLPDVVGKAYGVGRRRTALRRVLEPVPSPGGDDPTLHVTAVSERHAADVSAGRELPVEALAKVPGELARVRGDVIDFRAELVLPPVVVGDQGVLIAEIDRDAVLARRLMESLVIEVYTSRGRDSEIKRDGRFVPLDTLIGKITADPTLHLGRQTSKTMTAMKDLGDAAAHDRTYITQQLDLDDAKGRSRKLIAELLALSGIHAAKGSAHPNQGKQSAVTPLE